MNNFITYRMKAYIYLKIINILITLELEKFKRLNKEALRKDINLKEFRDKLE